MKTFVMTGGTSGLGRVAARRISGEPDTRLLLGARSGARAGAGETWPLDLSRLASVREFARAVEGELGAAEIDGLVLNAGAQFSHVNGRTEDGFESTFAVNHLAHYLLLRLLLPKLAVGATVVITTSDTHDPKVIPVGAPRELDPEVLARPTAAVAGRLGAGFRAYAASKLCNLVTARSLAALPDAADRQLRVIAYNPGFTPGTGLDRDWPVWVRVPHGATRLIRPAARFATVEQAGDGLADLALGRVTPPSGRLYASLVRRRLTWPDPSELARRDDVMDQLWEASARMTGLALRVYALR
jgi:NAD(P)-dependent dehydrogenase (short-subunit alcohol dehydrogenase family)